jgi:hypothetical protein
MARIAGRKRRKQLTIAFDAKLYPASALRETASAFARVADVTLKKIGGRVRMTILPKPDAPDDDVIVGELGNYALGLVCTRR